MAYVKATLAGLLAAVVAPILWILVRLGFDLASTHITFNRQVEESAGIGAVSVGFGEVDVLLAMFVGFAVAFIVVLRRARRAKTRTLSS